MSQYSLFGIESYQETRKSPKGRACHRHQLDMFALGKPAMVKPAAVKPVRGQRYLVAKTGMVVTFVRAVGATSLWECDGIVWRASREQVKAATLRWLQ